MRDELSLLEPDRFLTHTTVSISMLEHKAERRRLRLNFGASLPESTVPSRCRAFEPLG